MKTESELMQMTNREKKAYCKSIGVVGYSDMNSSEMIKAIIKKENPNPTPVDPNVYIDRNGVVCEEQKEAMFRVTGATWSKGIIQKFKTVEGEQYIIGLLDGVEKSQAFVPTDVELIVPKVKKQKPETQPAPEVEATSETQPAPEEKSAEPKVRDEMVEETEKGTPAPEEKPAKEKSVEVKDTREWVKGQTVTFTSAKNSKKAPGQELTGTVLSVKEGNGKKFLAIKVEGLGAFMKESSKCQ